jgi:hypothetical protein
LKNKNYAKNTAINNTIMAMPNIKKAAFTIMSTRESKRDKVFIV